jgi:ADP-heptose:LPS heptosyltransferase
MSAMGDVINTLPVLAELRRAYPSSRISWLVEPAFAPIVAAQPTVDETLLIPRKEWQRSLGKPSQWWNTLSEFRQAVRRIRSQRFDLALDFQGNLRSGVILALSGARDKVGHHRKDLQELDLGFTTRRATRLIGKCHRVGKALHLLRALGIEPGPARASLPIPAESLERVDQFLARRGLKGRTLIAVHPGTSEFGLYKRWTDDGYRALCSQLAAEMDVGVLLTWGGNKEREAVGKLAEGLPETVAVCFETTLMDLAAVYRRSALYVGADTGPGHLASLVGTPVVSIFGPKDPEIYRPYFSPCWVVERDLWCRPCAKRTCPDPRCMTEIQVEAVFDATMSALKGEKGVAPTSGPTRMRCFPGV